MTNRHDKIIAVAGRYGPTNGQQSIRHEPLLSPSNDL